MRKTTLPIAAIGAVIAATAALADPGGEYDGFRGHHMWDGGWGGAYMGFGAMLLFWGLVIAVVVLGARWLAGDSTRRDGPGRGERDRALDILRERFARGEIDAAEFAARKRALED